MGRGLRRRRPRRRDPRSATPSQSHADDPGRELSIATEEEGGAARPCTEERRVIMSHPARAASDDCGRSPALLARAHLRKTPEQEGSVLVSEGGQFLLSLDNRRHKRPKAL